MADPASRKTLPQFLLAMIFPNVGFLKQLTHCKNWLPAAVPTLTRKPVLCIAFILASLIFSVPAAEPNVSAIRTELNTELDKIEARGEAFSRKLEVWYAAFGQIIRVDHPREHRVYIDSLLDAVAPDSDLPKILQGMPGVSDRRGILAHHLNTQNLAAIPFDKKLWSQQPIWGQYLHYRLLKGYLQQRPPFGRTRADIEADLGPPSSTFRETFTYQLGSELKWNAVDSLWVDFILKNGKVSECEICHD